MKSSVVPLAKTLSEEEVTFILQGRKISDELKEKLKSIWSSVIRVFVSSTFTGML